MTKQDRQMANAIPTELAKRLGCYWRDRMWPRRPPDGGEYFDTYDGWQARGRKLRKGASRLQHMLPWEAAQFPWYETVPINSPSNDLNPDESSC